MTVRETDGQSAWMDQLPISARVKTGRHILRATKYIYLAAVGMLMLFAAVYALIWLPALYKLMSPIMFILGAQITVPCILIATTILTEASLQGPAITISRKDFRDNRSGLDVRWTDVRSIQFIGAEFDGRAGVTLGLRDKKLVPASGWRMHFFRLRTGSNEIHCPLLGLDEHQTYLAQLMASLVEQGGGVTRKKFTPTLGWRDWLKQSLARWKR